MPAVLLRVTRRFFASGGRIRRQ